VPDEQCDRSWTLHQAGKMTACSILYLYGLNHLSSITTSFDLLRHKRPIHALEAQSRILLGAGVEAYDTGSFLLLRVDIDAVRLEAAA
jgi:hypothetical protein